MHTEPVPKVVGRIPNAFLVEDWLPIFGFGGQGVGSADVRVVAPHFCKRFDVKVSQGIVELEESGLVFNSILF